eukprot:gnl/MRDRNA2_/MRDRNA2_231497_c0_seq1.p1 gnl/MRDRNA2_/MRDRNA2_231497_c0~~gnl/MRDRNA2_/MRDRNA2_231497_c0_seq1.p1  ORF type:complete len:176 (+),score=43.98 gnl/MRDRNA2_/MRDRNA2_231497_c0_seq1:1-528(+)
MTAVLLFHRLPEEGIGVDVVLEPSVAESMFWPHDMVNCIARKPDEALAEVQELLRDAPPGVAFLIKKLQEFVAESSQAAWWERDAKHAGLNKLTVLWEWGKDITDLAFLHKRHEGTLHAIQGHIVGRENQYSAVYVVCHGMTIARLVCGPSEPLNMKKIPKNLECRRIDVFDVVK